MKWEYSLLFLAGSEVLDIDLLCERSIESAKHARDQAKACGCANSVLNVAYLSNYLQGVGTIVLAHQFPEQYRRVVHLCEHDGVPRCEAEHQVFETTSAAVGGYLLSIWGFPQDVVNQVSGLERKSSDRPSDELAAV